MLLRKIRCALAVLAAGCVIVSVLAGPAPAGPSDSRLTIEVRPSSRVLWAETNLPKLDADRVEIRVVAPTGPGGRREVWQWCKVDYVGLGTYRCGVDFGKRSPLRDLKGEWAARLLIDGELEARILFKP